MAEDKVRQLNKQIEQLWNGYRGELTTWGTTAEKRLSYAGSSYEQLASEIRITNKPRSVTELREREERLKNAQQQEAALAKKIAAL